jgi:tRNA(Ile)-lysidine synthase
MLLVKLLQETLPKTTSLFTFTVNHNFRKGSEKEALKVHKIMQKMGVNHEILTWEHDEITSKLEESARQKRYDLIFDRCKALDINYLATAHHKDDQIETLLMRFFKGSGCDGLQGIAPVRLDDKTGIKIIRPMLELDKKEIYTLCRAYNLKWFEDKTNKSDKMTRNKIRKLCDGLKNMGLLTDEVLLVSKRASNESQALNSIAQTYYDKLVNPTKDGFKMSKKAFLDIKETEIQHRIINLILKNFSDKIYNPKQKQVELILSNLQEHKATTLRNALIKTSVGKIVFKKNN